MLGATKFFSSAPRMTDIITLAFPFSTTSPWYPVGWLALATKNTAMKLDKFSAHGKFGEVRRFIVPPVMVPLKCVSREAVEAVFGPLPQNQIQWANATWRPFVGPSTFNQQHDAAASEDTPLTSNNKDRPHERTR
jgi:hypothetical protein